MRRAVVLLAVGACRLNFEEHRLDADAPAQLPDATPDDAPSLDGPAGPALCGLPFEAWTITPPTLVAAVNDELFAQFPTTDRSEFDPAFSEDGRTLWFSTDQPGRFQVFRATRASVTAELDLVEAMPADVNAVPNNLFGFQALDENVAIITAPYAGELGGGDYWRGTLSSAGSGTWSWMPTSLSTTDSDTDARLTADGLELYFVRMGADRDIWRAQRPDVTSDFGAPSPVPLLNTAFSDSSPVPVAGGIFTVGNTATGGEENIYYAEDGGRPYLLEALAGPTFDGEPTMTVLPTGCEIIFVSDRDGSYDLYRAYVLPI